MSDLNFNLKPFLIVATIVVLVVGFAIGFLIREFLS